MLVYSITIVFKAPPQISRAVSPHIIIGFIPVGRDSVADNYNVDYNSKILISFQVTVGVISALQFPV